MILWITPKWPLPATDGARIATTQLLRNITALGVEVHLCSIVAPSERPQLDPERAKAELGVREVSIVERGPSSAVRHLWNLATRPLTPITLAPYATARVRSKMLELVRSRPFDLILYDGLHAGAWAQDGELGVPEAYRAHNVESEIWFAGARAAVNPARQSLLRYQGLLVRRVEAALARRVSYLFPVSFDDEAKFRAYGLQGTVQTLPIGVQVDPLHEGEAAAGRVRERSLLFVGKLDWAPNRDGLEWLLKNVWPELSRRAPDLKLTIVGSGQGDYLKAFSHLPRVEIAGRVERLAPYYENCVATLIPVFYGSGVRVKAIESSLYGRACFSTALGVEGMGLEPGHHYRRVESAAEWIHALESLDIEQALEMGRRAREHAESAFNPRRIATQFVERVRGPGKEAACL